MQVNHAVVLNTLVRVQRFMDTNASVLGSVNTSGYRHTLDDLVTALNTHAVNQAAFQRVGKGETLKQRILRNALKQNHMRQIASIAAAELKDVPEFAALTMPAANVSSRRLIAVAGAMGIAAKSYVSTFVAAGLSPDFIDQLQAASGALNASLTDRGATIATRSAATAGLNSMAKRSRQVVKVLDTLVSPQLAGDEVLLTDWRTAKRFGGRTLPAPTTVIDAASKAATVAPAVSSSAPSSAPAVPA